MIDERERARLTKIMLDGERILKQGTGGINGGFDMFCDLNLVAVRVNQARKKLGLNKIDYLKKEI